MSPKEAVLDHWCISSPRLLDHWAIGPWVLDHWCWTIDAGPLEIVKEEAEEEAAHTQIKARGSTLSKRSKKNLKALQREVAAVEDEDVHALYMRMMDNM